MLEEVIKRELVATGPSQNRGRVHAPKISSSAMASPGGVAQLVERVLYHSTRRAVPERSWVQSLLPTTEVEPGFSTFGGMLVPVLQLISPVCKTGTSLLQGPISGTVKSCQRYGSNNIVRQDPAFQLAPQLFGNRDWLIFLATREPLRLKTRNFQA
jgi:hypothetical protein